MQHLYTGKIHLERTTTVQELGRNWKKEDFPEYTALAKLYVFGEYVQDVCLRNCVISAFVARISELVGTYSYYPCSATINIIYSGTAEGSMIRKFLVDVYARQGTAEWIEEPENLSLEFTRDLARALYTLRSEEPTYVNRNFNQLDYSGYFEKVDEVGERRV